MRRRRSRILRWLLFVLVLAGGLVSLRQGWMPPQLAQSMAVDLTDDRGWFVDWRLAAMQRSPSACRTALTGPNIDARPIADNPLDKGCGWSNSFRINSAGSANISVSQLSCTASAALALWMTHEVQPIAQATFGSRVVRVRSMGTYSCRNIVGNRFWKNVRSEHATANAIDIAGFKLANGRYISIASGWDGKGREAQFLRDVHRGACRYFRVVLGPDFNEAHKDHFHLDRGPLWTCR